MGGHGKRLIRVVPRFGFAQIRCGVSVRKGQLRIEFGAAVTP